MVAIKGEPHHPHEKESESLRHRSLIKFVFFVKLFLSISAKADG